MHRRHSVLSHEDSTFRYAANEIYKRDLYEIDLYNWKETYVKET